jgi:hypothetical protein
LLPETVVTAVQYAPFIARYREILADELVQNVDCINPTGTCCSLRKESVSTKHQQAAKVLLTA